MSKFFSSVWGLVLVGIIIIGAGVGTAYLFSTRYSKVAGTSVAPEAIHTDTQAGINDTKQFSDTAQGLLEEGGINGEGTHHLTRDGGPSQNVYLVSSVVDLNEFVGKKVEVWGQTFDGSKAGWLMDVGLVKVLE